MTFIEEKAGELVLSVAIDKITDYSRGVYSPTGGDEERAMAKRYKENAEAIRTKSPKTAKIFDQLCERYLYEADSERESEEYVGI